MSEGLLTIGVDGFSLPREAIVSKIAILGMSGSGKTQTARKLAEAMMDAGAHIVVLAPASGWWGLRSSADGAGPGFPIAVFGGDHGDAPLRADAGEVMAAAVLKHRFNAIFDMVLMTEAEMRRFAADFLGVINRRNREPLHVIMDEFDIICPQAKSANSEDSRAAVNTTVRRGRIHGIGSTMITQNPQDADKSVLNMADVVIAMRMAGSQAIDAVKRWVERNGSKEDMQAMVSRLPALKTGTGWVWAPQLKVLAETQFLLCRTFDSSRTPSPGEHIRPPQVLAPVDMARLGAQIVKQAEEERESSPEYLRAELAKVRAELAAAKSGAGDVAVLAGMTDGEREEVAMLRETLAELSGEIEAIEAREAEATERMLLALELCRQLAEVLSPGDVSATPKVILKVRAIERRAEDFAEALRDAPPKKQVATAKTSVVPVDAGDLSAPRVKILEALAKGKSVGWEQVSKLWVSIFAGASSTSSAFANNLGALRTLGVIDYGSEGVFLTEAGLTRVQIPRRMSEREMHEALLAVLPKPQQTIMQVLLARRGSPIGRKDLAGEVEASPTSSAFANNLGALRSLKMLDYTGDKQVIAQAGMFLRR